jgi:hypothetical protein
LRQIRTVKFSNYDKGFGIKDGEFELIDTVSDACGAKFAGDVEHAWADYTGILGEPHYITTWIKLTDAQRSAIGRKGGRAGGLACTRAMTPDQLSARGKAGGRAGTGEKKVAAGRAAAATLTPAQRRANARKAARIQIAAGTQMNQQRKKCDHCETWSTPGCIARWHDDNCPRRPGGSQAWSSA